MSPEAATEAGARPARRGWERVDRYLTRDRLVIYPAVVVGLFGVVWLLSLAVTVPLPDFLARWTAGRLVLDGRADVLYDPGVQSGLQQALGADALAWFVSPPFVAVLLVPFGALPYGFAALAWTLLNLGLLWVSARALADLDPAFAGLRGWRALLLAGSCQAVLELVGAGQDSAVVLAALVLGARLLASGSDWLGGVVLALSLVKPQLAWLVPVALLVRGRWRALTGMVAGGLVLVGASLVALGPGPWADWVRAVTSPLYRDQVVSGQTAKSTSVNGLFEHLVPGSGPLATSLWVVVSVALVIVAVRNRAALDDVALPVLLVTAVPLTTVLLTPHAMVYDLVVVIPTVVWLIGRRPTARVRGLAAVGYVLLFVAPLLQLAARSVPALSVLAAPWVVVGLVLLWFEIGWSPRRAGEPEPGRSPKRAPVGDLSIYHRRVQATRGVGRSAHLSHKGADGRPRLTWVAALLLSLGAVAVSWRDLRSAIWVDLDVYLMGGEAITAGTRLYEQVLATQNGSVTVDLRFTYPPFAALLFAPLAAMSLDLSRGLFTLGGVVALGVAAEVVRRRLNLGLLAALPVYLLTLALEPFLRTLILGQINGYLVALVVVDCLVIPPRYRGLLTGVAAGIKLTPLAFVILPLIRRDWGWAARLGGSFLATIAIGFAARPSDSWFYWTGGLSDFDRFGRAALLGVDNQSLTAGTARLFGWEPAPRWLAIAVLLGVMAVAALVAQRCLARNDEVGALVTVGLASVVASPVAWSHHWIWVVLLLLWSAANGHRVFAVVVGVVFWIAPFWGAFRWPMALGPYDGTGRALGLVYVVTGLAALVVLSRGTSPEPSLADEPGDDGA